MLCKEKVFHFIQRNNYAVITNAGLKLTAKHRTTPSQKMSATAFAGFCSSKYALLAQIALP